MAMPVLYRRILAVAVMIIAGLHPGVHGRWQRRRAGCATPFVSSDIRGGEGNDLLIGSSSPVTSCSARAATTA
jgi:hypothetical protein